MPDLYKKYKEEVVPALTKQRDYKNIMEVPKLKKIVLSSGIGYDAERDAFQEAKKQLGSITGQMPVITKAKKNVANFKLRTGMLNGVMVTLRGNRMYEFLDRYVHVALPRVRDFRGIPKKGFDGAGNYNVGCPDITIFTEVDPDALKYPLGFNITMVTSARTDAEARDLLKLMDLPFAE
ncbi:MAG: 50S ribosomal protein L5 [Victivallales bacterium]|nr:50S ribosomal protein L5 [Victivallales bacterium]